MATVTLGLGANLGHRAETLAAAVAQLRADPRLRGVRVSRWWATAAQGGPPQPDYLNGVVIMETELAPLAVLQLCQRIEDAHGRLRAERWGPRTLDIDLVNYCPSTGPALVSADPTLTLPHPRAWERPFVLGPWAELEPQANLRTPDGRCRPVAELAAELVPTGVAAGVTTESAP